MGLTTPRQVVSYSWKQQWITNPLQEYNIMLVPRVH